MPRYKNGSFQKFQNMQYHDWCVRNGFVFQWSLNGRQDHTNEKKDEFIVDQVLGNHYEAQVTSFGHCICGALVQHLLTIGIYLIDVIDNICRLVFVKRTQLVDAHYIHLNSKDISIYIFFDF